jgi:hypothetical protein
MGLSLAVPAAAAAFADQCPQRESLIATDRPDITNSRLVVPQDSFQNEKGVIFTQRDGGYRITPTPANRSPYRLGLNDDAPAYIFVIGYSFRLDSLF